MQLGLMAQLMQMITVEMESPLQLGRERGWQVKMSKESRVGVINILPQTNSILPPH